MAGIVVKIGADTKELRDAVRGSRSALKSLGRQMEQNVVQTAKYGAVAAAAGAAIGVGLTVKGLKAVDAQAKLAKQLGTTSASMAAIARAGELSGISLEKVNMSAQRLTRRLSLAEAGTGPAADALERLGLSAAKLSALPIDQRIAAVNTAIDTMIPLAEQAGVATQLFGEEAGIAMRSLDAEVLRQGAREAERFGTAISDVDAAKVEAANDAFSQLGVISEGVETRLAVSLSSTITAVSNQLAREFGDSSTSMQEGIDSAIDVAVEGFADVIDGAAEVADFITGNAIMSQFGVLGFVLLGPKGALLGAAIGATFDMIKEGLADFGVGVSEGEDNARKLVNVQEEISRQTEIIGKAAEIGHGNQSEFVREANEELERLRATEAALLSEVEGNSESQAIYNDILNQGTDRATGFAGAARRMADAMRESREEAEQGVNLGISDGRGDQTPGGPSISPDEGMGDEQREKLAERIEAIRTANMTEVELLREKHQLELEAIREAEQEKLELGIDFKELEREAVARHEQELTELHREEEERRAEITRRAEEAKDSLREGAINNAVGLLNVLGRENKALAIASIAVTKGLAIAQTLAHTQTAAMLAYSSQLIPGDPTSVARATAAYAKTQTMGKISAGLIAATGLAQIAQATGGSGGGAGGGGGGAGGIAGGGSTQGQATVAEQPSERTIANISIQGGDVFSRSSVISLAEQMAELSDDGVSFRVTA